MADTLAVACRNYRKRNREQLVGGERKRAKTKDESEDALCPEASTEHAGRSFEMMNELRKDGMLCDVTVRSGDTCVKAHRIVLASCSEYFRACLTGSMQESAKRVVELNCVDGDTLKILIDFCYTGRVSVDDDSVIGLLIAANQLEIRDIASQCCAFLEDSMNVENALCILRIAEDYGCVTLIPKVERFVYRHFERIYVQQEFLELQQAQLQRILEQDELSVSTEEVVFKAIERWVVAKPTERNCHIAELLDTIRFELLPMVYIANVVHFSPLLEKCEVGRNRLLDAYQWHCSREGRRDLRPYIRKRAVLPLLFTVGGDNGHDDRNPFERAWFYHPHLQKWEQAAPLQQARSVCGLAVVENKMYVMGGYDGERALDSVEVYDPEVNAWGALSSMRQRRCSCAAAVLNGQIYVVGGVCGPHALQDVERYDPKTDRWERCRPMREGRSGCGLAACRGLLYAVGGINTRGETVASGEVYNPRLDEWQPVEGMNSPRRSLGLVAMDNWLYAVGGNDGQADLDSVECLNTQTRRWRMRKSMTYARMYCDVVEHGGKLFVVGGLSGSDTISKVECYSPESDEWHIHSTLEEATCGSGAAVLDAVASVGFGGGQNSQTRAEDEEEKDGADALSTEATWRLVRQPPIQPQAQVDVQPVAVAAVNPNVATLGNYFQRAQRSATFDRDEGHTRSRRAALFTQQQEDLGPLIAEAMRTMHEQYGGGVRRVQRARARALSPLRNPLPAPLVVQEVAPLLNPPQAQEREEPRDRGQH